MQKRPVRMRPLLLDIGEKISPHLPRSSDADHARVGNRLPSPQRQRALHPGRRAAIGDATLRQWVLKADEEIPRLNRRPLHRARDCSTVHRQVNQLNPADR